MQQNARIVVTRKYEEVDLLQIRKKTKNIKARNISKDRKNCSD